MLIPAARVSSPGAAVALIVGGCFVGLATGNLLVILQNCAPRGGDRAVDRDLQLHRQHRRDPVADHHRRADLEIGIVHAAVRARGRADRAGAAGALADPEGGQGRAVARLRPYRETAGCEPAVSSSQGSSATAPGSVCHACTSRPRPYGGAPRGRAWSLGAFFGAAQRCGDIQGYHSPPPGPFRLRRRWMPARRAGAPPRPA